jgi:hypothetical protein
MYKKRIIILKNVRKIKTPSHSWKNIGMIFNASVNICNVCQPLALLPQKGHCLLKDSNRQPEAF